MDFLLATLAFALVGFVVGRWPVVLLGIPVWVVYYIGEPQGWWGYELERRGELAEFFLAFNIVASGCLLAVGVSLRKLVERLTRGRLAEPEPPL